MDLPQVSTEITLELPDQIVMLSIQNNECSAPEFCFKQWGSWKRPFSQHWSVNILWHSLRVKFHPPELMCNSNWNQCWVSSRRWNSESLTRLRSCRLVDILFNVQWFSCV